MEVAKQSTKQLLGAQSKNSQSQAQKQERKNQLSLNMQIQGRAGKHLKGKNRQSADPTLLEKLNVNQPSLKAQDKNFNGDNQMMQSADNQQYYQSQKILSNYIHSNVKTRPISGFNHNTKSTFNNNTQKNRPYSGQRKLTSAMNNKNQKMMAMDSAKSQIRGQSAGFRSGALTGAESQPNIYNPDRNNLTRSSFQGTAFQRSGLNFYNQSVLDSNKMEPAISQNKILEQYELQGYSKQLQRKTQRPLTSKPQSIIFRSGQNINNLTRMKALRNSGNVSGLISDMASTQEYLNQLQIGDNSEFIAGSYKSFQKNRKRNESAQKNSMDVHSVFSAQQNKFIQPHLQYEQRNPQTRIQSAVHIPNQRLSGNIDNFLNEVGAQNLLSYEINKCQSIIRASKKEFIGVYDLLNQNQNQTQISSSVNDANRQNKEIIKGAYKIRQDTENEPQFQPSIITSTLHKPTIKSNSHAANSKNQRSPLQQNRKRLTQDLHTNNLHGQSSDLSSNAADPQYTLRGINQPIAALAQKNSSQRMDSAYNDSIGALGDVTVNQDIDVLLGIDNSKESQLINLKEQISSTFDNMVNTSGDKSVAKRMNQRQISVDQKKGTVMTSQIGSTQEMPGIADDGINKQQNVKIEDYAIISLNSDDDDLKQQINSSQIVSEADKEVFDEFYENARDSNFNQASRAQMNMKHDMKILNRATQEKLDKIREQGQIQQNKSLDRVISRLKSANTRGKSALSSKMKSQISNKDMKIDNQLLEKQYLKQIDQHKSLFELIKFTQNKSSEKVLERKIRKRSAMPTKIRKGNTSITSFLNPTYIPPQPLTNLASKRSQENRIRSQHSASALSIQGNIKQLNAIPCQLIGHLEKSGLKQAMELPLVKDTSLEEQMTTDQESLSQRIQMLEKDRPHRFDVSISQLLSQFLDSEKDAEFIDKFQVFPVFSISYGADNKMEILKIEVDVQGQITKFEGISSFSMVQNQIKSRQDKINLIQFQKDTYCTYILVNLKDSTTLSSRVELMMTQDFLKLIEGVFNGQKETVYEKEQIQSFMPLHGISEINQSEFSVYNVIIKLKERQSIQQVVSKQSILQIQKIKSKSPNNSSPYESIGENSSITNSMAGSMAQKQIPLLQSQPNLQESGDESAFAKESRDKGSKKFACSLEDDTVVVTMNLMQNEMAATIEVKVSQSLESFFYENQFKQKDQGLVSQTCQQSILPIVQSILKAQGQQLQSASFLILESKNGDGQPPKLLMIKEVQTQAEAEFEIKLKNLQDQKLSKIKANEITIEEHILHDSGFDMDDGMVVTTNNATGIITKTNGEFNEIDPPERQTVPEVHITQRSTKQDMHVKIPTSNIIESQDYLDQSELFAKANLNIKDSQSHNQDTDLQGVHVEQKQVAQEQRTQDEPQFNSYKSIFQHVTNQERFLKAQQYADQEKKKYSFIHIPDNPTRIFAEASPTTAGAVDFDLSKNHTAFYPIEVKLQTESQPHRASQLDRFTESDQSPNKLKIDKSMYMEQFEKFEVALSQQNNQVMNHGSYKLKKAEDFKNLYNYATHAENKESIGGSQDSECKDSTRQVSFSARGPNVQSNANLKTQAKIKNVEKDYEDLRALEKEQTISQSFEIMPKQPIQIPINLQSRNSNSYPQMSSGPNSPINLLNNTNNLNETQINTFEELSKTKTKTKESNQKLLEASQNEMTVQIYASDRDQESTQRQLVSAYADDANKNGGTTDSLKKKVVLRDSASSPPPSTFYNTMKVAVQSSQVLKSKKSQAKLGSHHFAALKPQELRADESIIQTHTETQAVRCHSNVQRQAKEMQFLYLKEAQNYMVKFNLQYFSMMQIFGLHHQKLQNPKNNLINEKFKFMRGFHYGQVKQKRCENTFCKQIRIAEIQQYLKKYNNCKNNMTFLINKELLLMIYAFFLKNGKNMDRWRPSQMDPDFIDFLEILIHYSMDNQRSQSATTASRRNQRLVSKGQKVKRSESQLNISNQRQKFNHGQNIKMSEFENTQVSNNEDLRLSTQIYNTQKSRRTANFKNIHDTEISQNDVYRGSNHFQYDSDIRMANVANLSNSVQSQEFDQNINISIDDQNNASNGQVLKLSVLDLKEFSKGPQTGGIISQNDLERQQVSQVIFNYNDKANIHRSNNQSVDIPKSPVMTHGQHRINQDIFHQHSNSSPMNAKDMSQTASPVKTATQYENQSQAIKLTNANRSGVSSVPANLESANDSELPESLHESFTVMGPVVNVVSAKIGSSNPFSSSAYKNSSEDKENNDYLMQPKQHSSIADIERQNNHTSILSSLLDSNLNIESGGAPIDKHNRQLQPIQIIATNKQDGIQQLDPQITVMTQSDMPPHQQSSEQKVKILGQNFKKVLSPKHQENQIKFIQQFIENNKFKEDKDLYGNQNGLKISDCSFYGLRAGGTQQGHQKWAELCPQCMLYMISFVNMSKH